MLGDALICFDAALLHQQIWNSTRKVSWGKKNPNVWKYHRFNWSMPTQPAVSGSQVSLAHHPNALQPASAKESWPQHWTKGQGHTWLDNAFLISLLKMSDFTLASLLCFLVNGGFMQLPPCRPCIGFFLALSSRSPHVPTWWQIERKNNVLTAGFWSHTQKMHGFQLGLHS